MRNLQKQSWSEVGNVARAADPILADIIDELSPSAKYGFYIVEYPYGDSILNKGLFQVRNQDNVLVPLSHQSIDGKVQDDLTYTGTIPVGMVIQNSIETFFTFETQTLPSSFYCSGSMVALWGLFDEVRSYQAGPLWSISSGVRTLCMLPRVTDKVCYATLKRKYELKQQVPTRLSDHWKIFAALANSKKFSQPWTSKMLFFSKEWFSHQNDKKWSKFYLTLLKKAWEGSAVKRNQFISDFAFSSIQKNRGLKPNPYLVDTAKHLVSIGLGGSPGFKAATDNIAAPIQGLQKVYVEDYGLKKLPIIMQLQHFSPLLSDAIYYSLEMPTTPIFSPRSSNGVSRMVDMRELKHILDTFFEEIANSSLLTEGTPLFNLTKNVKYDFYHVDIDQYNEISQITDIAEKDPNFKKILYPNAKELTFSDAAPFFTGCISLSRVKSS